MMDKTSENRRPLKKVEDQLTKDLEETTIILEVLGKKYGVSYQAIFDFCHRRGIKRPKKEHTENCSICQDLIRISKEPRSEFISSQTLREKLGLDRNRWLYHIGILRRKGLIPQRFGRLYSKKVELAYQIYFKKRLPVSTIGKQVGLKNFGAVPRHHKALGWDVPDPLFIYDGNARRARLLKMGKRNRRK